MENKKDEIKEAFKDIKFSKWLTPQIIPRIYVLLIVLLAVIGFVVFFELARFSASYIIFYLFLYVVSAMITLLVARVFLEGELANIRTAQNTKMIAEQLFMLAEKEEQNKTMKKSTVAKKPTKTKEAPKTEKTEN